MAGLYQLFFYYNYSKERIYEISAILLVYNPSHFVSKYSFYWARKVQGQAQ